MRCIKTGFYAKLPDGRYLYGDTFALPGFAGEMYADSMTEKYHDKILDHAPDHLLLRVCSCQSNCEDMPCHIEVLQVSHWFDELNGQAVGAHELRGRTWSPNSTLIASPSDWHWLGYNGREI